MNHDSDKWWPTGDPQQPLRQADMVYAALGPVLCHKLVAEIHRLSLEGAHIDGDVVRLIEELDDRDGRPPMMLPLMAVAAAAIEREVSPGHSSLDDADVIIERHLGEAYKLFGWQVIEMVGTFGFDQETFSRYLKDHYHHFGESTWPPPGVAYSQEPPR